MLIFHYSRSSGAVAAHILLEEAGLEYEMNHVSIPDGEHLSADFRKLNPKARLPVLETEKGILTENLAILSYVAMLAPEKRLAPADPWMLARAHSLNSYIASTGHIAFAHLQRGTRWTDDAHALEVMKLKVPQNMRECAEVIERTHMAEPWVLGDDYSMCDPYLFQFCRWIVASKLDLAEFTRLEAHTRAMCARPATRKVLEIHDIPCPLAQA